ncbi:putative phenylacetate--CoA ligase [Roseibium sp. TrichSKD4]|uniref:hypothetical protein n=1 Tax=Roseibium sp. TrichSKD4 TaxID=744980 RepID=UPI0001E56D9A|nr:hypothetical protein [Roseibium sp. TrichSKD4]EFO31532.1 putative phenylacetate--CoA ligase [Roseibium sp. TrichSKD4]
MTVSDHQILALFTMARAVHLDRSRPFGLLPWLLARRIGIRTEQVHALYDGMPERIGTTARKKLLAFNGLTEADLTNRPDFSMPEPVAEQAAIEAKVLAYRLTAGGAA